MSIKLKNKSETLLNTEFKISPKGYNALEVDTLFDEILKDYETVENNILISKDEYEQLQKEIKDLNQQLIDLKIDLDSEKSKWKYVDTNTDNVHIDNLVLLKRIGKLEKIIHDKLHLSIEDINTFDPDDC